MVSLKPLVVVAAGSAVVAARAEVVAAKAGVVGALTAAGSVGWSAGWRVLGGLTGGEPDVWFVSEGVVSEGVDGEALGDESVTEPAAVGSAAI
jgi:hypothetical protein